MSSQPVSSDVFGNTFEMRSFGRKDVISRLNGKIVEAAIIEEHEAKHKGATANDQQDMDRLGKKQELRVSRSA
jgi:hypothetical protein